MSVVAKQRRISLVCAVGIPLMVGLVGCGGADVPVSQAPSADTSADALTAGACNLAGTWAVKFELPVKWNASRGLQGGTGTIVQYAKSVRRQEGKDLVDTLAICGNNVPDYRAQVLLGNELYGIAFPNRLFDSGVLPTTEIRTHAQSFAVGSTYVSEPAVVQLGVKLHDPLRDPWPANNQGLEPFLDDTDGDHNPGITVEAKQGPGYSLPPTNIIKTRRATHFFTAVRHISQISGSIDSCDTISGQAVIHEVGAKPAINSHVVGCVKTDGTPCSAAEVNLLDGFAPVYAPNGEGRVLMQRVPADVTCVDVRSMDFGDS